jgi:glycogen operon protein
VVKFKLPAARNSEDQGSSWELVADTNMPDLPEGSCFELGHVYEVTARSLLLFELK